MRSWAASYTHLDVYKRQGYAKVDKAGIYNILIMEEKQSIIAAGAGASTKIVLKDPIPMPGSKKKKMTRLIRQENVKAVDAYIDRIDEMIERKGECLCQERRNRLPV